MQKRKESAPTQPPAVTSPVPPPRGLTTPVCILHVWIQSRESIQSYDPDSTHDCKQVLNPACQSSSSGVSTLRRGSSEIRATFPPPSIVCAHSREVQRRSRSFSYATSVQSAATSSFFFFRHLSSLEWSPPLQSLSAKLSLFCFSLCPMCQSLKRRYAFLSLSSSSSKRACSVQHKQSS